MKKQTLTVATVAFVTYLAWKVFAVKKAVPLEELEHSDTAKAQMPPMDNSIPAGNLPVAHGLAVMASHVLRAGWSWDSAHRGPTLNAMVGGVANSLHTRTQALDIYTRAGTDHKGRAYRPASVTEIRAHPVLGVGLEELIDEGDHIHCGWTAERLLGIG